MSPKKSAARPPGAAMRTGHAGGGRDRAPAAARAGRLAAAVLFAARHAVQRLLPNPDHRRTGGRSRSLDLRRGSRRGDRRRAHPSHSALRLSRRRPGRAIAAEAVPRRLSLRLGGRLSGAPPLRLRARARGGGLFLPDAEAAVPRQAGLRHAFLPAAPAYQLRFYEVAVPYRRVRAAGARRNFRVRCCYHDLSGPGRVCARSDRRPGQALPDRELDLRGRETGPPARGHGARRTGSWGRPAVAPGPPLDRLRRDARAVPGHQPSAAGLRPGPARLAGRFPAGCRRKPGSGSRLCQPGARPGHRRRLPFHGTPAASRGPAPGRTRGGSGLPAHPRHEHAAQGL